MNYILIFCLILPSTAFAYFDIGTGSYLFQIILASLFGGIYTVRNYISHLFRKVFKSKKIEKKI